MPLLAPLLPGDHFVLRPLNPISTDIQLLSLLCCPFTYALNRKHLHVLSLWEQGHLHSQPEKPLKKVLVNINSNQDQTHKENLNLPINVTGSNTDPRENRGCVWWAGLPVFYCLTGRVKNFKCKSTSWKGARVYAEALGVGHGERIVLVCNDQQIGHWVHSQSVVICPVDGGHVKRERSQMSLR